MNWLSGRDNWLKFTPLGKSRIMLVESMKYASNQWRKNQKKVNMHGVGLGNTRIFTNYGLKILLGHFLLGHEQPTHNWHIQGDSKCSIKIKHLQWSLYTNVWQNVFFAHYSKSQFTPWTWKMACFHGPTWWSKLHGLILLKIKFIEHLGPSLRVTQLGTKRNDHAPEGKCDDFLNICPKLEILRKSNQVWPFSCLHLILS
jgi:hypothetical protein